MKSFLEWVNQKHIAPWVALIFAVVLAYARLEATSQAQITRITELKQEVTDKDEKTHDELEKSMERVEFQVDAIKDSVRDLSADLAIVCDRVQGNCRPVAYGSSAGVNRAINERAAKTSPSRQ